MRKRFGTSTDIETALFRSNLGTVLLSELSFAACTVIDGIIACRFLGSETMAAVGITSPFASLLAVFSGMLGIACQAGCSRKIGEGKPKEASDIFSTVLTLSLALTILLTGIFIGFAGLIVRSWGAIGGSAALAAPAAAYLRACALGIPGMILYYIFSPVLLLEGKRKYIKLSTVFLTLINILGDLLNIFVFGGGVIGLGLATASANLIALGVMLYGFFHAPGALRFSLRRFRLREIPRLLYLGLSKAIRRASNALRPIFLNRVISVLGGSLAISAYAVQSNLRSLLGVVSAGIAGTMLAISGVLYHERDAKGMRRIYGEALKSDLLIAVPAALVFAVLAPLVVRLYITDSPETAELALLAVRCYALALPFVTFNEIYINYFQSLGKVVAASVVSVLSRVGMIFPWGFLALWADSVHLAFCGLFLSEFCLSLGLVAVLLIFGKGETPTDRLLLLGRDFRGDIKNEFSVSLPSPGRTFETVPYEMLQACRDFGVDESRANRVALLCEELLQIKREIGFGDKDRLELKLMEKKDGTLELRCRDNCSSFDAEAWFDAHIRDEEVRNSPSLRILLFLSSDYCYQSTFSLNNMILRVD